MGTAEGGSGQAFGHRSSRWMSQGSQQHSTSMQSDTRQRGEERGVIDPATQWYLLENIQLFPEPQAPFLAAGPGPLGLGRRLLYASTISHSSDASKTFACDLSPFLKSGLEQASDVSTKAELDNQVYLEKDSGKGLPRPV